MFLLSSHSLSLKEAPRHCTFLAMYRVVTEDTHFICALQGILGKDTVWLHPETRVFLCEYL